MKHFILLCLFPVLTIPLSAQITGPEQDCEFALPLCGGISSMPLGYYGRGNVNDVPGGIICLNLGERNSVWLRIKIDSAGFVAFDIHSDPVRADHDFAVYNTINSNCSAIHDSTLLPVRCSYAAGNVNGATGLRPGYNDTVAGASGPDFLSPFYAEAGSEYAIVINNAGDWDNGGFILDFTNSTALFENDSSINSIALDTIFTEICMNDSQVTVIFPFLISCQKINPDGTNFSIVGPSLIAIDTAITNCIIGLSNSVTFNYTGALLPNEYYHLVFNYPDTVCSINSCSNDSLLISIGDSLLLFSNLIQHDINVDFYEYTATPNPRDFVYNIQTIVDGLMIEPLSIFSNDVYLYPSGNEIFTIDSSGIFEICAAVKVGCYIDTICKMVNVRSPLGINESSLNQHISIHPNPVKDFLNIELSDTHDTYTIEVSDITGKIIMPPQQLSAPANQINLTAHPNGIYFLNITNTTGSRTTRKIMLMH